MAHLMSLDSAVMVALDADEVELLSGVTLQVMAKARANGSPHFERFAALHTVLSQAVNVIARQPNRENVTKRHFALECDPDSRKLRVKDVMEALQMSESTALRYCRKFGWKERGRWFVMDTDLESMKR